MEFILPMNHLRNSPMVRKCCLRALWWILEQILGGQLIKCWRGALAGGWCLGAECWVLGRDWEGAQALLRGGVVPEAVLSTGSACPESIKFGACSYLVFASTAFPDFEISTSWPAIVRRDGVLCSQWRPPFPDRRFACTKARRVFAHVCACWCKEELSQPSSPSPYMQASTYNPTNVPEMPTFTLLPSCQLRGRLTWQTSMAEIVRLIP